MQSLQKRCMQADTVRAFLTMPGEGRGGVEKKAGRLADVDSKRCTAGCRQSEQAQRWITVVEEVGSRKHTVWQNVKRRAGQAGTMQQSTVQAQPLSSRAPVDSAHLLSCHSQDHHPPMQMEQRQCSSTASSSSVTFRLHDGRGVQGRA